MRNPVQIIESTPGSGLPHITIEPDYVGLELKSSFWDVLLVLLVNLATSHQFRDFENKVHEYNYRYPELFVKFPIVFNESSNSYRILDFKECYDIEFERSTKDAPSKYEMFIDIKFKALLMSADVKNPPHVEKSKNMQAL